MMETHVRRTVVFVALTLVWGALMAVGMAADLPCFQGCYVLPINYRAMTTRYPFSTKGCYYTAVAVAWDQFWDAEADPNSHEENPAQKTRYKLHCPKQTCLNKNCDGANEENTPCVFAAEGCEDDGGVSTPISYQCKSNEP